MVPRLQGEMPELLQLGDFAPEKRIGPAIWLRCVIAGLSDGFHPTDRTDRPHQSHQSHQSHLLDPSDRPPILYLPGVSRQDLRAVESCPDRLKPLAELQYRGVIWSQVNAKDWTILAFLKSNQGGLGLDVAQDKEAKHAMQLALYVILEEELERLQGKHLDKDYFNTPLSGGDPVRDLLQWLDQGDAFKAARDENAWQGFVEICKSQLAFNPDDDGPLKGAEYLAGRQPTRLVLGEPTRPSSLRWLPYRNRRMSRRSRLLSGRSPSWTASTPACPAGTSQRLTKNS